MELDRPMEFDIASGDDILIRKSVENYNKTYKTDFEIVKFIYDEVVFARIKVTKCKISDIFALGYQFGSTAQHFRQKGEIDW